MRKTPLKRKTPVKRANAPRKAKNFERAYGGESRVLWLREQPCMVCGGRPSENAHAKTGGTGRKADARWIVPLCHSHHAELHAKGHRTFEFEYNLDLFLWAQIVDARWEQSQATGANR